MQKLLVFLLAVGANLIFVWYGHKTGSAPDSGTFLGFKYDSRLASSLVLSFKFILVLLIANAAYTLSAKNGIDAFGSFLPFIIVWIASAPVAALTYSIFVTKESVNWLHLIALLFVFAGSILVSANKEILQYLK